MQDKRQVTNNSHATTPPISNLVFKIQPGLFLVCVPYFFSLPYPVRCLEINKIS
jgi:hypothetical protein